MGASPGGRRISPGMKNLSITSGLIILGVATFTCLQPEPSLAEDQPRHFELRAESDEFWKLIDRDSKLEKIGGGFGFTEGPVWDPAGFLYVSDEEQNKIYKLSLN